MLNQLKDFFSNIKWDKLLLIYSIGLLLTLIAVKLPNPIHKISNLLVGFTFPFNWNHGIAIFITAFIGYKLYNVKSSTSLLGNNKIKTLLFPLILLTIYSTVGVSNKYGVNNHLWGFLFLFSTLIYDVLEEKFWRGFLNDVLPNKSLFLKYIITGILWACWHLLIFKNFNQWGGFHVFLLLSILVSFLIGYATTKTNSVLVAASIHALLVLKNINVTILCFVIWLLIILTWNKKLFK